MPSRNAYPWQKVCDSVLQESDPAKAFPLYERALSALEVRFAELGTVPATNTEQKALLAAIAEMRRRLCLLRASDQLPQAPAGLRPSKQAN
jgi:hypothetical protein